MWLPIQYALSYPLLLTLPYERLNFNKHFNPNTETPNK